ncbi:MAG: nlaIVR [Bacteroidetes bacterium]|nr:nlaIVR [Bacteroidota bacterium]
MMDAAEKLYDTLKKDFGFEGATGSIQFRLKDFGITVEQNNIVGNILEEWLAKWMFDKGIPHIHNLKQESPDFWLNLDNLESDWLEVKSFTGSPNFDVAAFRSFINLVINKPYKLHSKYLLIKYKMDEGVITIENVWLKNLWEISCTSERYPIKVQYKNKVIVNLRPAIWYSNKTDYPTFDCLGDFLAALEETIFNYHDTRSTVAEGWSKKLSKSYKAFYGIDLNIPRWYDVKDKYKKKNFT